MVTRLAAAILALGVATPALASDDAITLMLDRATVIKAPAKTVMVVIGNPAIADVSVQRTACWC